MTQFDPLGFVPVEDIHNVWTTMLSKLEELGAHRDVITYVDSVRLELQKRARSTVDEVVTRMPGDKKQTAEEAARVAAEYEKNQELWRSRTRLGRQYTGG